MPAVHDIRSALRHKRGDEDGFTLVELLVVVLLLGLVSFVMLNFMTNTMSVTNRASKDLQAEQKMTIALRQMSQEIRSASSITQCAGAVSYKTCLVLTIPRSVTVGVECPARQITYRLASGTVREDRVNYPANACSPTTTQYTNRPVLESVTNTSTEPLFTYYDENGASFDPDVNPAGVATAGSIKTDVKVDYGIKNAPKVTLSSMAALRNRR